MTESAIYVGYCFIIMDDNGMKEKSSWFANMINTVKIWFNVDINTRYSANIDGFGIGFAGFDLYMVWRW